MHQRPIRNTAKRGARIDGKSFTGKVFRRYDTTQEPLCYSPTTLPAPERKHHSTKLEAAGAPSLFSAKICGSA